MSLPALAPPASLDTAQPAGSQFISEGDDWIRYLQQVLKTYLVNVGGVVNATHTELNHTVGATSKIQDQLNALTLGVAAALGNSPLWVSGGTYAAPAVVYSPLDNLNYRKITASSVTTTDPSLDTINWLPMYQPRGTVLLDVKTASASATIDFASFITSTYDEYEIHFQNAIPSIADQLVLQTSSNAGVSYDSTAGNYSWLTSYHNTATPSTVAGTGTVSDTKINVTSGSASNTASFGGVSGVIRIINPAGTASNKAIQFSTRVGFSGGEEHGSGSGTRLATAAVNAVRLKFASGNIATGSFKLYGLRKAV